MTLRLEKRESELGISLFLCNVICVCISISDVTRTINSESR